MFSPVRIGFFVCVRSELLICVVVWEDYSAILAKLYSSKA